MLGNQVGNIFFVKNNQKHLPIGIKVVSLQKKTNL